MTSGHEVRCGLTVAARDGTALATDVYRPPLRAPVPTVLIRTPYGKSAHLDEGLGWARRGFACVVQDVRGRHDSSGVWEPYRGERGDGAASVEWITGQEWSDDRVVAVGGSYAAFTAWSAALAAPTAVAAVISSVPAMGFGQVKFDPSGVLRLADHTAWWLAYGDTRTARPGLAKAMLREEPALLSHLPVSGIMERLWAIAPGWGQVVDRGPTMCADHVSDDELAACRIPSLHVGGWYDPLVAMTLRQWDATGRHVHPRPTRALILGPWRHGLTAAGTTVVGDRDHGPGSILALGDLQAEWARGALDPDAADAPRSTARVFVLGTNRWTIGEHWPPAPYRIATLHAGPDRGLHVEEPEPGGAQRFDYDPLDPFPSRLLPVDRADLDSRRDAVRFTTSPISAPMTIVGRPQVTLTAMTDAPSTDFVLRLLEVDAAGRVLPLARGCVVATAARARYDVALAAVAVTVPRGHRLRLEVTSSDFPDLARNLNTGEDRYRTRGTRMAHQSILHGRSQGTSVAIPLSEPA